LAEQSASLHSPQSIQAILLILLVQENQQPMNSPDRDGVQGNRHIQAGDCLGKNEFTEFRDNWKE
jgi:hypothetical protein